MKLRTTAWIWLALLSVSMVPACALLTPEVTLPTPTASATRLAPASLPYRETWSNPGTGWEIGTYDSGTLRYGDGYYSVTSSKKGQLMWGRASKEFTDVAIEVDATQISASDDNNNGYGVMCRVQGNDDGYLLRISGDGQAAITRVSGDNFVDLAAWAETPAVAQGNASNHLRAVCSGTHLSLSVNGQLVAQTDDSTYASGDLALTATTFTDTPTEIHYQNLVVTAP